MANGTPTPDFDLEYQPQNTQAYEYTNFVTGNGFSMPAYYDNSRESDGKNIPMDSPFFAGNNTDYSAHGGMIAPSDPGAASSSRAHSHQDIILDMSQDRSPDSTLDYDPNTANAMNIDFEWTGPPSLRRRSSTAENDNLTPAQSRRKAQNRAAQRAFRERKERHVKELETELANVSSKKDSLQSDNEKLRQMLQRMQTENKILRIEAKQQSTLSAALAESRRNNTDQRPSPHASTTASSQNDLEATSEHDEGGSNDEEDTASASTGGTRSSTREDSQRQKLNVVYQPTYNFITPAAAWDMLQAHPSFVNDAMDIKEVCERLKSLTQCDGSGPVFDKEDVKRVIIEAATKHTADNNTRS